MRGYLGGWLAAHHPRQKRRVLQNVRTAATINSLEGAITMLKAGVGVAVLPRHCVEAAMARGELAALGGSRPKTAINQIHIVTLAGRQPPRRVQQVIAWFMAMQH
jgi:DNA-binding transcriptional LysR family regulator